jgi:hypothetical protein
MARRRNAGGRHHRRAALGQGADDAALAARGGKHRRRQPGAACIDGPVLPPLRPPAPVRWRRYAVLLQLADETTGGGRLAAWVRRISAPSPPLAAPGAPNAIAQALQQHLPAAGQQGIDSFPPSRADAFCLGTPGASATAAPASPASANG